MWGLRESRGKSVEPISESNFDEKLNRLGFEIGQNPDAFDDAAWLEFFDASMLEAEKQQELLSETQQKTFTEKNLAEFELVKEKAKKQAEINTALEEILEKSLEIEEELAKELKTEEPETEAVETPAVETLVVESVETVPVPKKRIIGWRKRKKAILLAAAIAVMALGSTMVVQGNRAYELKQYLMQGQRNVIVNYNSALRLDQNGDLNEAYEQIREKLDIEILELGDMPSEMKFQELILDKKLVTLKFNLNDKNIYFRQKKISDKNEVSEILASDRNTKTMVYNEWLNQEIAISKNVLKNGEIEYSADFVENNMSYYLSGIMEEEIFLDLVKGIHK